jgi:hypothetical protein
VPWSRMWSPDSKTRPPPIALNNDIADPDLSVGKGRTSAVAVALVSFRATRGSLMAMSSKRQYAGITGAGL